MKDVPSSRLGEPDIDKPAETRSKTFFYVRVAVLLTILLFVLGYAWRDFRSRSRRNEWSRPLSVAFVVVAPEPLEDGVRPRLLSREVVLEQKLADEMRRYDDRTTVPILVEVIGPLSLSLDPPPPPRNGGILEAARYAWDLNRFTSAVDDHAKLDTRLYDSRIYIVARPKVSERVKMIEGASQDGGRIGVVACEIDEQSVDFTLFVATHELFHTLGATDKYGPDRLPLAPDGLAEPTLAPLYPQRKAELMAGTRALSPVLASLPLSLDELAVGELTAREIGWLSQASGGP